MLHIVWLGDQKKQREMQILLQVPMMEKENQRKENSSETYVFYKTHIFIPFNYKNDFLVFLTLTNKKYTIHFTFYCTSITLKNEFVI